MSFSGREVAHIGIYGNTGSGKSTLGRKLGALARSVRRPLIVGTSAAADPLAWGFADHVTTDGEKLARLIPKLVNSFVIIDEAWQLLGNHGGRLTPLGQNILTMRHRGNTACIIVQRPSLISLTVRDQLNRLFTFRVGQGDAADLVTQYGHEQLKTAAALVRGSYMTCSPWEGVKRGRVF